MRTIKTRTVSSNVYSKEAVKNKNKSNSNLKNTSICFDMKGKDADKNNNSEKSTCCFMNCKVLLEDVMKSKLINHGPFKKTSETSDEQNKSKENPNFENFEVHEQMESANNRFETKNRKKTTNKMKTGRKATQDKPTEMPGKTSKKNKDRNSNTNIMKTAGPKEKHSTETTVEKSSNLPVNKDGIFTESAVIKDTGHKATKAVSFNENSNETMQNKKKSNSKSHYLNKDVSNSFDMKGKDADKNNKSEKCFMNCKVLVEDVMKSKLICQGQFEKTSETLDERNKPKENPNFEVLEQIRSAKNRFVTKNGKKTTFKMKTKRKAAQDKLTEMPSKTSKKNKNRNSNTNNMKTAGLKEKQDTKTTVEKSSLRAVTKDEKHTESAELEEVNADQGRKNYTTATTVNSPTVMVDAHYQECNTSNSNDCRHKRKLSDIKEVMGSLLKRLKFS